MHGVTPTASIVFGKGFLEAEKDSTALQTAKCHFLKKKVSFLGHAINASGVHMDPEKVSAIKNYPVPKNGDELGTFLGMASSYRKFCLGFAKTARRLFSLTTTKEKWSWQE